MITDLIIVKAKFALYSTDKGGRKTPIISGYRPNHVFEYKENSNDFVTTYIGDVNFEGQEFLSPDETIITTVRFLRHGNIEKFLQKGRIWWIHEGKNKIGEAKIIEI